jgi:anti-sigma-K factor RskA
MKERLMAVAHAEAASARVTPIGAARRAEPAGGSGFRLGMGVAAAAAVLIALVSTIQNFSLRSDIAAVNRHAAQLQSQVAEDATLQRRDREMVADIVAPDAQHFTVSSGEVIRHGGHVYFALSALPALPKGKVYQAWTLAKGAKNVAPSVTFVPAAGGVAIVALPENAADIAAVAVSVEPEGGSKTPTTKPTFVRPLS